MALRAFFWMTRVTADRQEQKQKLIVLGSNKQIRTATRRLCAFTSESL